jgi:hypothetical protein
MEKYDHSILNATVPFTAPVRRRRRVAKPALSSASTERGRLKALLARSRLLDESVPPDSPRRKVSLLPVNLPPLEEGLL